MAAIKFNGWRLYFDCTALHFLCRPPVLEHLNVFKFYSQCEVINKIRKNEEDLMEMINTQHQHPSFDQEKNRFIQGVHERLKKMVHFCQYDFLAQSHSMVISWTVIWLSMHQWRCTVETCYYCSTPFMLNLI